MLSPMQALVNANAAEFGFTPHVWTVGRGIRTCDTCGTREAYWDDDEYPINPCRA